MVQQMEFKVHSNIKPLPLIFFFFFIKVKVKGESQIFKKKFVNVITWKIIIGSLQFLLEVINEYGDDLSTSFHILSKWPSPGD